jgi:hypothetical protein
MTPQPESGAAQAREENRDYAQRPKLRKQDGLQKSVKGANSQG